MKTVILAGGLGTRLLEETVVKPKPLVPIGEFPIIWHIMKIYHHFGFNEFIICLGKKGELIKEYFVHYGRNSSDLTVNTYSGNVEIHQRRSEDWRITLADTGEDSMTGGRIKAISRYLSEDEPFMMTYGDGVGDIDINALIEFHRSHGKDATVTAVTPPGRFGILDIDERSNVRGFREKIASDQYKINAGFFVLSPRVLSRIDHLSTVFEQQPLESLADDGELMAYDHSGFWQPMDTLRDKNYLDGLWNSGNPPWAVWRN